MPESRPQTHTERLDLGRAEDPRDVVHRAVAALAQGEGVILATGGLRGLAAGALHPEAVARLAVGGAEAGAVPSALTLLLKGADEVADWVPGLPPLASRLARRAWPGPVSLVFPAPGPGSGGLFPKLPEAVREAMVRGGTVELQAPDDPFLREVLRLLPGPVVFRPVPGSEPLEDDPGFRLRIESDANGTEDGPTVVRVGPEGWSVVRPGVVDAATLTRMAGTIILFVCTGNTCRSPMAEALCKVLLAERLGCTTSDLEGRGYVVLSAGIAAMAGMPAAAHAVDVVRARGGSLHQHKSQRLTLDLVRHADLILAMTGDHLEVLLEHAPEAAPRTRLLHPQGHDVADPVGADRETYQRSAEAIESYLHRMLDSLGV